MKLCSILVTLALAVALAFPAAAETWNTPTIEGVINIGMDGWDADDWAIDDPATTAATLTATRTWMTSMSPGTRTVST